MSATLDEDGRNLLFRQARTHNAWLDRPVSDETLRELYELMKWGPTSANSGPARILFLRTRQAKESLRSALLPMNVDKTLSAPVTAVIAYDEKFFDLLPKLLPHNPQMRDYFADSPELALVTAQRNSSLQGAYLMLAARALGLDCGPMSGFDHGAVDREFFPQGGIRSNFLCNLGYGDGAKLFPRSPRLAFDEACSLL